MFRGLSILALVANKAYASSLSVPGTYSVSQPNYVAYPHNLSAYQFSESEYDKDQPYYLCGTSPVVEKYFSKYGRGDLVSYETMNEVFESPEQLADLRTTVDKLLKDLRGPLEQVPEQVKGMAQGGIGSSAKRYASGLIGYLRRSTGHKFSTFLSQNKGSLLFPAEFFSKYTDFLLKHITAEITEYGKEHDIPDELFERLGVLNEIDKVATVCGEHDWAVPIDRILSVINKGILDSYGHLSTTLEGIRVGRISYLCKDEIWAIRVKAYKHFITKTKISLYEIMNKISDIQHEVSPESPRGIIQSDSIYDVTSPSNKAGQSEDIDVDPLKGVIKRLNDAKFNSGDRSERMKKVKNIDKITPLSIPMDPRLGTDYHTFKYSEGSKTYFLKSIDSGRHNANNNDILFETLNSPYIAKTYKILYNHVTLENSQPHDRFWVVSEFLDISNESLDGEDINALRRLSNDILSGLDYLQSRGIVHNDLYRHLENVRGKQVQVNGKTEYRFKIIDFGLSYLLTEANSLGDAPGRERLCGAHFRTGRDLEVFKLIQLEVAKLSGSEKLVFDGFVSECWKESYKDKPDIKGLLQHPFITGEPFTTDSQD